MDLPGWGRYTWYVTLPSEEMSFRSSVNGGLSDSAIAQGTPGTMLPIMMAGLLLDFAFQKERTSESF